MLKRRTVKPIRKKPFRNYEEGGVVEEQQATPIEEVKEAPREAPPKEIDMPKGRGGPETTKDQDVGSLGLPDQSNKRYERVKDKEVKAMVITRAPVSKVFSTLFNVVSLGAFGKLQKKLGYDQLYHLRLVLILDDGSKLSVEKNQNIKFGDYKAESKQQELEVETYRGGLTVEDIMKNGKKRCGDSWARYDAFSSNCQAFIACILKGNGLYTNSVKKFVYQDAESLAKSFGFLEKPVKKGVQLLTDVGSILDKFTQKLGFELFQEGGVVDDYGFIQA